MKGNEVGDFFGAPVKKVRKKIVHEFKAPKMGNIYAGMKLESDKVTIFSATFCPYSRCTKNFYKKIDKAHLQIVECDVL